MPIAPQPGILEIAPYVGGAAHVPGRAEARKLSSNENPAGPPPEAVAAIVAAAKKAHRYPSSDHAALRDAIGAAHGIDPARIVCGAGSDEIISWLCSAYAGSGCEVVIPQHGFLMYRISALAAGATPVFAPETSRTVDPDAIIAAATPATRLIFVADPANPTGTMIGLAAMARIAEAVPQALLVIDGAYAEYVDDPAHDGGAALAATRPNVVMTRTFSKIYGLGAMRVGWATGPADVIDVLNRVRGPFNLSQPAIDAAQAAVAARDFVDRCRAQNAEGRARLTGALRQMGIACDDSAANFVLARFADAATAEAADAHLLAEGIIARRVAGYGLPDCLRITVGLPDDIDAVLAALRGFLEARA